MPPRVPPGRAAGRVLLLRRDGRERRHATFVWSCRSVGIASGGSQARWHSLKDMGLRVCARQNRLALDVLLAVFFVLLEHRPHARRDVLVARAPQHAGLDHAGRSGAGRRLTRFPPAGAYARHRDTWRVQPGHLPAHLPRRPDHPGKRRDRVGAPRNRSRCIRAVLLRQGPARGVRGRRHADAHRGPGLGTVPVRHLDRRAENGGRAADRALLHRAARGPAGPARPGRTRRAGALPARRAGQGRRTGPARG